MRTSSSVGVESYFAPAGPGSCSDTADEFIYAIDVSTWERQTHSVAPILFEFDLDLNRDGTADYAIYNRDLGRPREPRRRPERDVRAEPRDR